MYWSANLLKFPVKLVKKEYLVKHISKQLTWKTKLDWLFISKINCLARNNRKICLMFYKNETIKRRSPRMVKNGINY